MDSAYEFMRKYCFTITNIMEPGSIFFLPD